MAKEIVTIQKTGKGYKAVIGIGSVIMFSGVVSLTASIEFGIILILLGGATMTVGSIGAWWAHG
jgi:hypothetical protein